jgi:DNA helicase HerA-like ATPase
MFGSIISIIDEYIKIENLSKKVESALVGMHLVFEKEHKIVCEITSITREEITCIMIGEFANNDFLSGILHRPNYDSKIRLISKEEVVLILGNQKIDTPTDLYIGKSLTYAGYNVSANIDRFFSNHFAIIGNTGSGKSCTVARLFQNLFYRKQYIPNKAHFALFDVYGEYHTALDMINKTKYCRCKYLTTDVSQFNTSEIVKIPPYFLEADDYALLLNATSAEQIPIIEKALKYVYLFTEDESKVIAYKNNIIAKAVLDILTSGKNSAQIRDQVFAILTTFNTSDINLESEIVQPGYTRTLMQCLMIDNTGKINAIQLVTEFIERFVNEELKLDENMRPKNYTLKDLYNAFEFALISEGILKSDKVYDMNNILKVRLDNILNGDYGKYFEYDEYITREEYIKRLYTNSNEEAVQIVNFNLNYVDERFAKTLTKIFSKLFLNYAMDIKDNTRFSVEIMLEEAHRYVQRDSDLEVLGYNIFDRITKEGRKYGVILGLITQRPSELSVTSLSQCSNYIVLRMFHPDDLQIIRGITHSISDHDLEKLKSLTPGTALCFGSAFRLPVYTKIDKPNPMPTSTNVDISAQWFTEADKIQVASTGGADVQQKNAVEVIQ